MALRKGAVPKPIPIGEPTELRREDLSRLNEHRFVPSLPQRLRDSHHRIARLAAMGLRGFQIAEKVGYSSVRVNALLQSPAMQELVAQYRAKVDEAFIETQDEYYTLATANMLAAERHIADKIAELDEEGNLLGIREALAISRDGADRFGYGKKSMNVNLNVDFAAQLERAIKRSGKEGLLAPTPGVAATQQPAAPSTPGNLRQLSGPVQTSLPKTPLADDSSPLRVRRRA